MPEKVLPETLQALVKLASLGTSGICIFAIFWIGLLLRKPSTRQDAERQRNLRFFMVVCVVISLISAGTGLWGGRIDERELAKLRKWKQEYGKKWNVTGIVRKSDGSDPGDVTISTCYPPLTPDGNGRIIDLRVGKNSEGHLPSLSFHCPGCSLQGKNLNSIDLTGDIIDIGTITLRKLPGKQENKP